MTRVLGLKPQALGLALMVAAIGWWITVGSHDLNAHSYPIQEVELGQAKALIDSGALVIDVRDQEDFDHRHIPGAILIPLAVLRSGIPASIVAAKDKKVVVYCNHGLHHGPEGTHILNQAGFPNAVNLKSGIEGWADAGLQLQKN